MSGWLIGYDARERRWSRRQMDELGIPMEILPEIVKPWHIVGFLSPDEAAKMGAARGHSDSGRRGRHDAVGPRLGAS